MKPTYIMEQSKRNTIHRGSEYFLNKRLIRLLKNTTAFGGCVFILIAISN